MCGWVWVRGGWVWVCLCSSECECVCVCLCVCVCMLINGLFMIDVYGLILEMYLVRSAKQMVHQNVVLWLIFKIFERKSHLHVVPVL
jgi:hypothetical protein